jgi:hypothetical protein
VVGGLSQIYETLIMNQRGSRSMIWNSDVNGFYGVERIRVGEFLGEYRIGFGFSIKCGSGQ